MMWWLKILRFYQVVFGIAVALANVVGNPAPNGLNAHIRDYSVKEDINSTHVRTLQKEDLGRYADFAPVRNKISFKEVPDNALSSSTYGHPGLAPHDHGGYGLHEYEENPHFGYGYEYHVVPDHGGYDHHHSGHRGHGHKHGLHHLGYGHHHKHYDHALAAKSILWPIAGIALLGAATAALVSNPVLLQLGVISGRRRRRDTEEDMSPIDVDTWATKADKNTDRADVLPKPKDLTRKKLKNIVFKDLKQKVLLKKAYPTAQSSIEGVTLNAPLAYNRNSDEDRFIPIPLKDKNNYLD